MKIAIAPDHAGFPQDPVACAGFAVLVALERFSGFHRLNKVEAIEKKDLPTPAAGLCS